MLDLKLKKLVINLQIKKQIVMKNTQLFKKYLYYIQETIPEIKYTRIISTNKEEIKASCLKVIE